MACSQRLLHNAGLTKIDLKQKEFIEEGKVIRFIANQQLCC